MGNTNLMCCELHVPCNHIIGGFKPTSRDEDNNGEMKTNQANERESGLVLPWDKLIFSFILYSFINIIEPQHIHIVRGNFI